MLLSIINTALFLLISIDQPLKELRINITIGLIKIATKSKKTNNQT